MRDKLKMKLNFSDGRDKEIVLSAYRPNLQLRVHSSCCTSTHHKQDLGFLCERHRGAEAGGEQGGLTIIYVRRIVEMYAIKRTLENGAQTEQRPLRVEVYHSSDFFESTRVVEGDVTKVTKRRVTMSDDEKQRIEREAKDGKLDVLICTVAYGLGIDNQLINEVIVYRACVLEAQTYGVCSACMALAILLTDSSDARFAPEQPRGLGSPDAAVGARRTLRRAGTLLPLL